MRISRIVLENWRNFGSVDVALQDRVFVVGPNAAGKSNFLDVFRFLRDLVIPGGGFEKAILIRGGVSSIRNLAARRYPNIVIDVSLAEEYDVIWRYRIAFTQDNRSRPELTEEAVWHGQNKILSRPDDEDKADPERQRQTHLEQTFANSEFRDIASFFETISYFHVVPQVVRTPDRWISENLDPYGGDFLERIAQTSSRIRDARLRYITGALKAAVPQLQQLKLETNERGIPHLYANYTHWRPYGAWQSEAQLSDGTLRLIGLLWSLLDGRGPLLLEEPELSLHPALVRHIPDLMLRVQRRGKKRQTRQVLLSTHSSDLLIDEGIAPDELMLLRPGENGTAVEVGVNNEQIRYLLETGLPAGAVVIDYTAPENLLQLSLWGE